MSGKVNHSFAFLWAIAHVFHHLSYNFLSTVDVTSGATFFELLSIISIVPVLIWPGRHRLLAIMAAAHLVSFWIQMPFITNHTIVLGLVDAAIVLSSFGRGPSRAPWIDSARLVLITLYAFASFYKFNSDYFFAAGSCSRLILEEIQQYLTIKLPQWAVSMAGPGSWMVEAGLVLLLLLPRTVRFGAALALVFHWILALDGLRVYHNFSAPVFAIVSCFLPGTFERAFARFKAFRADTSANWLGILVAGVFLPLMAIRYQIINGSFADFRIAGQLFWLGLSTPALYLLLCEMWKHAESALPLKLGPVSCVVFLLAILNGLGPVLGLKSGSGFDMYSNLRLEQGESNHFLLKDAPDMFGWRSDLVTIHEASDPIFRPFVERQLRLPFFELHRLLSERPEAFIVYSRAGHLYRVVKAGEDSQFAAPIPYLLGKLVYFRAVNPAGRGSCTW